MTVAPGASVETARMRHECGLLCAIPAQRNIIANPPLKITHTVLEYSRYKNLLKFVPAGEFWLPARGPRAPGHFRLVTESVLTQCRHASALPELQRAAPEPRAALPVERAMPRGIARARGVG